MGWPEDGRAAVAARGACASQRHFATSDFWGSGLYYDEYYDATLGSNGNRNVWTHTNCADEGKSRERSLPAYIVTRRSGCPV